MLDLDAGICRVRSWRRSDAPALAHHANNRKIWLNVRDLFPSPYTLADARRWLETAAEVTPAQHAAIALGDEAVGGIGLVPQKDVMRVSAEIGYWLGEAHWGKGIMTAALSAFTEYAFTTFALTRIFATTFDHNPASMRVLEKAGYAREGILRASAIKDGRIIDQTLYAMIRPGNIPFIEAAERQSGERRAAP